LRNGAVGFIGWLDLSVSIQLVRVVKLAWNMVKSANEEHAQNDEDGTGDEKQLRP
jgi:hypothetical protein